MCGCLCSVDDVVDKSDDNEETDTENDTENEEIDKDQHSLVILSTQAHTHSLFEILNIVSRCNFCCSD